MCITVLSRISLRQEHCHFPPHLKFLRTPAYFLLLMRNWRSREMYLNWVLLANMGMSIQTWFSGLENIKLICHFFFIESSFLERLEQGINILFLWNLFKFLGVFTWAWLCRYWHMQVCVCLLEPGYGCGNTLMQQISRTWGSSGPPYS